MTFILARVGRKRDSQRVRIYENLANILFFFFICLVFFFCCYILKEKKTHSVISVHKQNAKCFAVVDNTKHAKEHTASILM